jgi:transposase-like protein
MTDLETRQNTVRQRFTAEQKMALVQAAYEPGARVVEVARKYNAGL